MKQQRFKETKRQRNKRTKGKGFDAQRLTVEMHSSASNALHVKLKRKIGMENRSVDALLCVSTINVVFL